MNIPWTAECLKWGGLSQNAAFRLRAMNGYRNEADTSLAVVMPRDLWSMSSWHAHTHIKSGSSRVSGGIFFHSTAEISLSYLASSVSQNLSVAPWRGKCNYSSYFRVPECWDFFLTFFFKRTILLCHRNLFLALTFLAALANPQKGLSEPWSKFCPSVQVSNIVGMDMHTGLYPKGLTRNCIHVLPEYAYISVPDPRLLNWTRNYSDFCAALTFVQNEASCIQAKTCDILPQLAASIHGNLRSTGQVTFGSQFKRLPPLEEFLAKQPCSLIITINFKVWLK